jgi:isopentenyl-diphosphate Delta-isomerase
MSDPTSERKIQHIRIIENDADADRRKYYFDDLRLTHRALPEVSLPEIDTSITFLGKPLRLPLLISSMTGGDHELTHTVNRHLAEAAEATGIAMGVGSQRVMFTQPEARASFALREWAPTTPLCANLGAVQLNYGFSVDECQTAIDIVGADALFLHLNPLQEAIQPEGNTAFAGLAVRIRELAASLATPVIIKEVGAGISLTDAQLLLNAGIRYIDVAGTGGLSWSRIEHHRRAAVNDDGLGLLFQDWGIPTPLALRELSPLRDRITLIASGGIRSGLDMAKAIVLGASLCGLASPFLRPAMTSTEAVVQVIERLEREFRTAMFLLGAGNVAAMQGRTEWIISG